MAEVSSSSSLFGNDVVNNTPAVLSAVNTPSVSNDAEKLVTNTEVIEEIMCDKDDKDDVMNKPEVKVIADIDNGTWPCIRCTTTNPLKNKRCKSCLCWRGGKRKSKRDHAEDNDYSDKKKIKLSNDNQANEDGLVLTRHCPNCMKTLHFRSERLATAGYNLHLSKCAIKAKKNNDSAHAVVTTKGAVPKNDKRLKVPQSSQSPKRERRLIVPNNKKKDNKVPLTGKWKEQPAMKPRNEKNRAQVSTNISPKKRRRCGECRACLSDDCGKCRFCLDMKKYGGTNKLRRPCIKRQCQATERPEKTKTNNDVAPNKSQLQPSKSKHDKTSKKIANIVKTPKTKDGVAAKRSQSKPSNIKREKPDKIADVVKSPHQLSLPTISQILDTSLSEILTADVFRVYNTHFGTNSNIAARILLELGEGELPSCVATEIPFLRSSEEIIKLTCPQGTPPSRFVGVYRVKKTLDDGKQEISFGVVVPQFYVNNDWAMSIIEQSPNGNIVPTAATVNGQPLLLRIGITDEEIAGKLFAFCYRLLYGSDAASDIVTMRLVHSEKTDNNNAPPAYLDVNQDNPLPNKGSVES